jgi:hypothetical protein
MEVLTKELVDAAGVAAAGLFSKPQTENKHDH